VPKWLKQQNDLDDIARRRCLMVLSVLSGETPVSEAIVTAKISRGTYYQLETRALHAMLRALTPGAGGEETATAGATKRTQELERRVKKLEQDKRRLERLWCMTRKLVKSGPMKAAAGRPRRPRTGPGLTSAGKKPSAVSSKPTASSTALSKPPVKTKSCVTPSTPTKVGGAER
jgi:hypothetical protein